MAARTQAARRVAGRATAARLLAIAAALAGGCGSERGRPAAYRCAGADAHVPSAAMVPAPLLVAGSGAALPLAHAAARRLPAGSPGLRLAASIGSGAALRALVAGDLDVALVADAVTPTVAGTTWRAVAAAEVVLVSAPPLSGTSLTEAEVAAAIRSAPPRWPGGAPLRLLLREPGDSGLQALARARPMIAAALEAARARGEAPVLDTDQAMVEALAAGGGALGLLDRGMIGLVDSGARAVTLVGPDVGGPPLRRIYVGSRNAAPLHVQVAADALAAAMRARAAEEAGYAVLP